MFKGLVIGILCVLFTFPVMAHAQVLCKPYKEVLTVLKARWGETLVARGVSHFGPTTEIFANPLTKTYTIVLVSTNKIGCAMDAGDSWEYWHQAGDEAMGTVK
jgi:hypothetical protein